MNPPPEPRSRVARSAEIGALTLVFGLLVVYVSRVVWDVDVFWHIAAGRAFVDQGAIPTTDIFSAIDPARRWITFQWGYEVLVYGLDRAGGLQLVRAVHAAVMVLAFLLFWVGCRRRLRLGPWVSLALLVLLVLLFGDRIRVRPHVFNLLAWCLVFPVLVRGPAAIGRAATFGTAALVAVWANLHAGGAFLFLVAAAALPVGAALQHVLAGPAPGRPMRRALGWYMVALAPALVSPNFVAGNVQALTMLSGSEHLIREWWPSWYYLVGGSIGAHAAAGVVPTAVGVAWAVVAARALATFLRDRARAFDAAPLWAIGLALALVVLAHRSVRFVYLAVFALLVLRPWLRPAGVRLAGVARVALVLGLVGCATLAYHANVSAQHGDLATAAQRAFGAEALDRRRFPTAQADFLAATGFEGAAFTQANWGGYLLYRLWPAVRVTADGRGNIDLAVARDLERVYDPRLFLDPRNGPAIEAIYTRYPVDVVVHQHPVWPRGYLPDPARWALVFGDDKGAVWVRRDREGGRAYLARLAELARASRVTPGSPGPR